MRSALSSPILKCRFEKRMVDIVTKVTGGGRGGVRLEEKGKCLEHGTAAGVASEERVGLVEMA